MKFFNWQTPLQRAIEQGLKPGGDLAKEIGDLDDYKVSKRKDAEAICDALEKFPLVPDSEEKVTSSLHALAGLFQDVDGTECSAFDVLLEQGVPELIRIATAKLNTTDDREIDDLLFVLKILALYGTHEGAEMIVKAARRPLRPDRYMWSVILGSFKQGHPEAAFVMQALSDPLPREFLAVSLLDAANGLLIGGEQIAHPFDSPAGKQRLKQWLSATDPEEFSYAHSATAALPFINGAERGELLSLAMRHPHGGVQMEAAWAAAKLGMRSGLESLAHYCLDPNRSVMARRYLEELGAKDEIPEKALEPDFQAVAEFTQWLTHPNELGRAPDELEIVDRRELAWPPSGERKPFWLIRYLARDTTGLEPDQEECGLVGSMTFCFFSYKLIERPPEDAYAIHCYWEMEHAKLIEETDVSENPSEYADLLKQWKGEPLVEAKVLHIAEIAPELKHPQRVVAVASGKLKQQEGWVVIDGDRSRWYPKSDMPTDTSESVVLKIHVGRRLLGFGDEPDRRKFLKKSAHCRAPEEIVRTYEKLVEEAQRLDEKKRSRSFSSFGPINDHWDAYVDALIKLGRQERIKATIDILAPHWQHNSGYATLGNAAFKCNLPEMAERFLTKLRDNYPDYCRSEGMSQLAEIWFVQGRKTDASALLIDCLKKLLQGARTAEGSDRQLFNQWFQQRRQTFMKLFGEQANVVLRTENIPDSTLNL